MRRAALVALGLLGLVAVARAADEEKTLAHGGRERRYLVVAPEKLAEPPPLLLVLHGGDSDVSWMRTLTKKRFEKLAAKEGWLVVYPSGVDNVWNDGRWIDVPAAPMNKADDVGFLASLIDVLARERGVDRARVYVTGASNGGMMTHRVAMELSDRIAAAAPVMAQIPAAIASRTRPARPVPVLLVSGDADPIVPYEGGDVHYLATKLGKVLSTRETARYWTTNDRCGAEPKVEDLPDADPGDGTRVRRETWAGEAPVVLYTIQGGGHTWPGGTQYLPKFAVGATSRDVDACEVIVEFFKGQKLGSARRVFR